MTLTCGGIETTFTQWLKGDPPNGQHMFSEEDDRVVVDGEQLTITGFHAATHAGSYSCLIGLSGGNAVVTCPANLSHASE